MWQADALKAKRRAADGSGCARPGCFSLFPATVPPKTQCGAMPDAACCGDRCSTLRWPTQRAAFSIPRQGSTAGRLPLHPSLRLPAASSSLRKSPVSVFVSCGPVPSAALGCASCCAGLSCSLVRVCAFCCAVQCILLREPMAWQVWVAAVEMTWGWDCEAWGCGPGGAVGGLGEIDRCVEKRSAAGWIGPTAALACAERQGFEPWIQSPVCRISSAVHSTTLASLLFGECCSACAMRLRVVVEAVEQSLSKRKVTATFSFQQTLERKSVLRAGCFYFPGRWFVLSEQRLSVIQTGVLGFPSRVLFLFRQKSQAFRAEVCVRSDRRIVPSSHLAEVGRRSVLAGSPCPLVLPP